MWLIIIIALILILRSVMTSHKAALRGTASALISTDCGSSGENFNTGCTMVAGVCETNIKHVFPVRVPKLGCDAPPIPAMPALHCDHIVAHFPVTPPPIRIQIPSFIHCDALSGGGGSGRDICSSGMITRTDKFV